jgi:D-arabinose 1-dehydrogenase-like Zn-dependent alcohol dehydrogenase
MRNEVVTMLGVLLPDNKEVRLKEFPDPEPKPDQVLIMVEASQICRSDMSLYYGWSLVGKAKPGTVIAGHHEAGVNPLKLIFG